MVYINNINSLSFIYSKSLITNGDQIYFNIILYFRCGQSDLNSFSVIIISTVYKG